MEEGKGGKTPTERGGGARWSGTKLLRKGILADEATPATRNESMNPGSFVGTMWGVVKPPLTTSYTLRLWRLLGVYNETTGDVIVEAWVLDAEYTGLTANVVKYQNNDGCRLAATITDIVVGGGIGVGHSITHTGVNRHL